MGEKTGGFPPIQSRNCTETPTTNPPSLQPSALSLHSPNLNLTHLPPPAPAAHRWSRTPAHAAGAGQEGQARQAQKAR